MAPFEQVLHDETLPVFGKFIFGYMRLENQACSLRKRLQKKPHLSVVSEGFVVPYSDHRLANGLLVDHSSLYQFGVYSEAFLYPVYQKFLLQFSHDADLDLLGAFLPGHFKGGILFFKFTHLCEHGNRILSSRQT